MRAVGYLKRVMRGGMAFLSLALGVGCGGGSGEEANACSTIGKNGKIACGEACAEGQPSVGYILVTSEEGVAQCTGAYISTTAVLTAAHCFTARPQEVLIASRDSLRRGVSYVVHPYYDGGVGSAFDMAVVKVDEPMTRGPSCGLVFPSSERK